MTYTIPDEVYDDVMLELGYPAIKEETFELSKDQIIERLFGTALREYFNRFPLKDDVSYPIGTGPFNVPFPEDAPEDHTEVIGAMVRFIPVSQVDDEMSVFAKGRLIQEQGMLNMSGHQSAHSMETYILQSSVRGAAGNDNRTFKPIVDRRNKVVKGFSNENGSIVVTWLRKSTDWDHIPYYDHERVLNLCKIHTLRFFANLLSMANDETPGSIDPGVYKDRADELKSELDDHWNDFPHMVISRG
jgi:hypothetical protein